MRKRIIKAPAPHGWQIVDTEAPRALAYCETLQDAQAALDEIRERDDRHIIAVPEDYAWNGYNWTQEGKA